MSVHNIHVKDEAARRRQLMVLALLHGLEVAGVRPVERHVVHRCVYLADALAPVWDVAPVNPVLLKTSDDPVFPEVDGDIAHLVGIGLVQVGALTVSGHSDRRRWYGAFALHRHLADRVLAAMTEIEEERRLLDFYTEVAQAAAGLPREERRHVLSEDATYGDPRLDEGDVLDIGQWRAATDTATAHVARYLRAHSPRELHAGEVVDIYVDHLTRRLERA